MKSNTIVRTLLADGVSRCESPAYRVPGCFFVVIENAPRIKGKGGDYSVTDPNTGACIAHCNYFQTACRFASMLHDIILPVLPAYANADLAGSRKLLESANLRSFYPLRFCRPGQFEQAYFEQQARNAGQ